MVHCHIATIIQRGLFKKTHTNRNTTVYSSDDDSW